MNDILLDSNDDLLFVNGDFALGESTDQEVGILLRLNPGELKEDPLLGPGLIRLIHSEATEADIKRLVKLHLARDGKSYEELQERIRLQLTD